MTSSEPFEIFLICVPGLEPALLAEARENGCAQARPVKGGVTFMGGWQDVWRANLDLRGATRVLARIGEFRAFHLAQLDKRARKVAWGEVLRADVQFRVEASCKGSRIYHSGAAAERIERAIAETLGATASAQADVAVMSRIESDVVTISIDTSGELLHKRGHKEAVAKAPMRETMASLFLRQCAYTGKEPLVDPMCGSGTFVIEAAEIAAGLKPGRARSFAFEKLATFDEAVWRGMRSADGSAAGVPEGVRFYGSDRDAGAIAMSRANAERAGVGALTEFTKAAISELAVPPGPPGLVIVNPPYGARLGEAARLGPLYRALGQRMITHFAGWRVGLITTEAVLAKATGLPFKSPSVPVAHGGIKVRLWQTGALPG